MPSCPLCSHPEYRCPRCGRCFSCSHAQTPDKWWRCSNGYEVWCNADGTYKVRKI